MNAEVNVGVSAARLVDNLGQGMLRARPPTGWPDGAAKVVSSGGMLSRFNASYRIAAGLLEGVQVDTSQWDALAEEPHGSDGILEAILQQRARGKTRRALREAARDGADSVLLAAIALSSPEFQQQ